MNKNHGQLILAIALVMLSMISTSCGGDITCYNSVYKMTGVDSINRNITKINYSGLDGHEVGDTVYSQFVIKKWDGNEMVNSNANCRWVIVKVIDDGTK
jgi:hypothetical protein